MEKRAMRCPRIRRHDTSIMSSAPRCPAFSRRSGSRWPATAATAPSIRRSIRAARCGAPVLDGVSEVVVADIDPNRKTLDTNCGSPLELELQYANAEIIAHLRHAGEQARPVPLQVGRSQSPRRRCPGASRRSSKRSRCAPPSTGRSASSRSSRRSAPARRSSRVEVEVLAREQTAGRAESARDFIDDEHVP